MPRSIRLVLFLLVVAAAAATGVGTRLVSPVRATEVRPLTFPVEGPATYRDDFGDPRAGHTHQGNDIFAAKLKKLYAANAGRITWTRTDSSGTSGNMLILRDADGWEYWYIHINNDTPGTDDGANPPQWILAPGITTGSTVTAGQHIAYLGDSGNAENTSPHLHFELHRPDGTAINPYPSLQAAQQGGGTVTPTHPAIDITVNPLGGHYVLRTNGAIVAYGGAPKFGEALFAEPLARSMAVMPDGNGYVVLDGWGAVHKFGSAKTAFGNLNGPYWQGWDIARSVAITRSGAGFAVLDGWGGVHAVGDAPALSAGYWSGQDIARDLVLTNRSRGIFVLLRNGNVRTAGNAVFKGNANLAIADSARSIVSKWNDGYAVLDGTGKLHTFGTAQAISFQGTTTPTDRWRAVALLSRKYIAVRDDLLIEKR